VAQPVPCIVDEEVRIRGREHHHYRQSHRRDFSSHRQRGVAANEWSKAVPGVWFYDPAFMYTAACESSITYLDGEAGVLATGLPDRAARREVQLLRSPTCC